MWYSPSQPGSSLVLLQGANTLRIGGGLYLYDESKNPTWFLTTPVDWTDDQRTGYRFEIFRTTGTPYTLPYSAADTTSVNVGTATLTFVDRDHMTLSYTIGAVTKSVPIVRFGL